MIFSKQLLLASLSILSLSCLSSQGFVIRPSSPTSFTLSSCISASTNSASTTKTRNLLSHHHQNHHRRRSCETKRFSQSSSSSSSSSVQKSNEDDRSSNEEIQSQTKDQDVTSTMATATTATSSTITATATTQEDQELKTSIPKSNPEPKPKPSTQDDLYEEAKKLRLKAKQLLQEAAKEEQQLLSTKLQQKNDLNTFLDDLIQEFITLGGGGDLDDVDTGIDSNSDVTSTSTSSTDGVTRGNTLEKEEMVQMTFNTLKEKNLSSMKLIQLIERIHEREMNAKRIFMDYTSTSTTTTSTSPATTAGVNSSNDEKTFTIGDTSNAKDYNQNELISLQGLIDSLITAQSMIDNEESKSKSTLTSTLTSTSTSTSLPSSKMKIRMKELKKEEEELYQRQLANKMNANMLLNSNQNSQFMSSTNNNILPSNGKDVSSSDLLQDFMKETLGEEDDNKRLKAMNNGSQNVTIKVDGREITGSKFNITNLLADIVQIPLWVPSSLLPYVIVSQKELEIEDLKKIKTDVLLGSQFQCTSWDSIRFAAIYRGNLMDKKRASSVNALSGAKNPTFTSTVAPAINNTMEGYNPGDDYDEESLSAVIFHDIQQRLQQVGLSNKIQLFIMEDPEWRPGQDSRQPEPQTVILAVSSEVMPDQGTTRGRAAVFLAGLSIVSTIFTTFAYAISSFALNPTFFNGVINESDISILWACLPIFIGVFGMSAFHEAMHLYFAKKRGVKLGLPVPLPSLQIGTFGNITPFRSFPQSRTALFDIALSGPLITSLVSMSMIIGGILLTINTPADSIPNLAVVPAVLVKTSFLIGSIVTYMAPKVMMLPLSQPIPIHPLFLVGFVGLVSSALNMLPIGKLDGGRACNAVFGRRPAYLISLLTLSLMAFSALSGWSTLSIFWGLLITLFQRNADVPIQDELSEVNDFRLGVYIFSIIITVLTLAPFPGIPGL